MTRIQLRVRRAVGVGLLIVCAATVSAQEFRLGIGAPIAAGATKVKKAFMAVRVEGCDEPGTARVTATAEGLVNGVRRSVPVTLLAGDRPGVYSVLETWPAGGLWVLNLNASYRNLKAGALVPIDASGFHRDPAKFYPRFATPDEVEAALKQLAAAARK